MAKTEDELLSKLHLWLAERGDPPSIFHVTATGDSELVAAFVLEAFRAAAREAVLRRIERDPLQVAEPSETSATLAIFRVFDRLSRAWSLTAAEELRLLGLKDSSDLRELRTLPLQSLPTEIIERVAMLLDIFKAINTLLPQSGAADAWIRKPNLAPVFSARSALDMMLSGLDGLQTVRTFLEGQVLAT